MAKRFWDEGAEEASDSVDVICGVPLLPGLTWSGSSAFQTIVKGANLSLIVSEPMRAAIAFKWAAYGRQRWYWWVGWYAAYVISFLGGVGWLLSHATSSEPSSGNTLGEDKSSDSWWKGMLAFAVASLINLRYACEEMMEARSIGMRAYLASATNLIDASLHGLVLSLVPVLLVSSELAASRIAAVSTLLLFLKGQKVYASTTGPRLVGLLT